MKFRKYKKVYFSITRKSWIVMRTQQNIEKNFRTLAASSFQVPTTKLLTQQIRITNRRERGKWKNNFFREIRTFILLQTKKLVKLLNFMAVLHGMLVQQESRDVCKLFRFHVSHFVVACFSNSYTWWRVRFVEEFYIENVPYSQCWWYHFPKI